MSDPICFTWKVRSSLTNASASLGSNLSLAAAELGGERSWGRRCKWRVAFPLNASLIRFTCPPSAPHRDYFSLTTPQPAAANCTAVCRLAPFPRETHARGPILPPPSVFPRARAVTFQFCSHTRERSRMRSESALQIQSPQEETVHGVRFSTRTKRAERSPPIPLLQYGARLREGVPTKRGGDCQRRADPDRQFPRFLVLPPCDQAGLRGHSGCRGESAAHARAGI